MRLLGNHRSLDLRDKAILLVGFAGAFRRGEVTNLRWSDVRTRDGAGIVIHLRRSKTDQAGRGKDVGIPLGRSPLTCPVRALTDGASGSSCRTGRQSRRARCSSTSADPAGSPTDRSRPRGSP